MFHESEVTAESHTSRPSIVSCRCELLQVIKPVSSGLTMQALFPGTLMEGEGEGEGDGWRVRRIIIQYLGNNVCWEEGKVNMGMGMDG